MYHRIFVNISAATIEQLDDDGTVRTLLLSPRPGEHLVVALPDEYDEPRDGPLHFLDQQDAVRYAEAVASCRVRRLGPRKLQRRGAKLSFSTEWRGIRARDGGLSLYVLSLPCDAVIDRLLVTAPNQAGEPLPRRVLRDDDRRRFTIYVETIGTSLDFDLNCDLTLSPETFSVAAYCDADTQPGYPGMANAWRFCLPSEEASRVGGFFAGNTGIEQALTVGRQDSHDPVVTRSPRNEQAKRHRNLRILHISDLHERAAFEGMPSSRGDLLAWDAEERGLVLGSRFSEALLEIAKDGIDLVA